MASKTFTEWKCDLCNAFERDRTMVRTDDDKEPPSDWGMCTISAAGDTSWILDVCPMCLAALTCAATDSEFASG